VAAQVPEGFKLCLDQNCAQELPLGEWYELTGTGNFEIKLYSDFPAEVDEGCFGVEWQYQHQGETAASFWRGPTGVRMDVINTASQLMTLEGSDSGPGAFTLDGAGTYRAWFAKIEYPSPEHPYSFTATGSGSGEVCVEKLQTGTRAYMIFHHEDGAYYNTSAALLRIRWSAIEEPPPPPPTSEFCLDGYEVISETLLLDENTFSAEVTTQYSRVYARYTFSNPNESLLLHYVDVRANTAKVRRQFYGDEMQTWDPVTGWTNDAFSFSVPNVEEADYRDFEPTAYVTGPVVSLYAAVGYNPLNLVSVCIVPVLTSEFCQDGVEALQSGPVFLDGLNGEWERKLTSEISGTTHFVVRYRVANPNPGGGGIDPGAAIKGKFMPQIQANFFYIESPIAREITFTLPLTSIFPLVDDFLQLRFYNRYDPVILQSVCVVDGSEEHLKQLSAEDCNLINPDFVTEPTDADWKTQQATWVELFENGGMELAEGAVWQNPQGEMGNVWQMEVRARSTSGGDMEFGTQRPSLLDGGPQMKTVTMGPQLALYRNNIYAMPTDWVLVTADEAAVDYVCLMKRAGILEMPDCGERPLWNPEGSGDSLIIYVFKFTVDSVLFGFCQLFRLITAIANVLWVMLEDILLRIPALPKLNPETFWIDLGVFLRLAFEGFQDWLSQYLFHVPEWAQGIIENIGRWLGWQWRRAGQWFDWLLYDIVVWLSNQFGVTPQAIFDILYDIGYETRLFWKEMQDEVLNEGRNLMHLLINTVDVLLILASGVRSGVSGNAIANIGGDLAGIGAFIWDGVDFVNDAVDMTPLSALNIVALGVIGIGLLQWSLKKFSSILSHL
jgi:hypothetical protein